MRALIYKININNFKLFSYEVMCINLFYTYVSTHVLITICNYTFFFFFFWTILVKSDHNSSHNRQLISDKLYKLFILSQIN